MVQHLKTSQRYFLNCPLCVYIIEFCGQISIFVLHSVFEEGTTEYLLLKALWCFVEVDIYASLEVHTEKTIESGRENLTCFFELINVSPLHTTLVTDT